MKIEYYNEYSERQKIQEIKGGALREKKNVEENGIRFLHTDAKSNLSKEISLEECSQFSAKGVEKSSMQEHEEFAILCPDLFVDNSL